MKLRLQRIPLLLCVVLLVSAGAFLLAAKAPAQEQGPPLLAMISVDGMRPDYITQADEHGAKVPNLRRFLKEATHAEGVVGIVSFVAARQRCFKKFPRV